MNTQTKAILASERPIKGLRLRRMRLIMALCLLEFVPAILIIVTYLGLPLIQLVNLNQLLIFFGMVAMIRGLKSRAVPFIAFASALLFISLINALALTGNGNFNFEPSAIFPYYYSLVMPALIFISVYSQNNVTAREVLQDLRWFSRWFLILISPTVLAYAILHFSGRISYFGFGVNFHYASPYFLHRGGMVLLIASLVLISGKRAVLINFLVQLLVFKLGEFKRSPLPVLLFSSLAAGVLILSLDNMTFFLRRFTLMLEALQRADTSNGILGLANSYEALVLFGGRLEEAIGIIEYFNQNPSQVWFGSPPGANFVWRIESSDLIVNKSFAHLTWLGYIFRFGIIPTAILLAVLIYRLVLGWDTKNPLWLVFFGILVSATFGGNLFYSPVAWVMVALYFRFGSAISQEIRKESGYSN